MVLGDFNLPSLGMGYEVVQEFMAALRTMGLSQVTQNQTQGSDHTAESVPVKA